MEHCCFWKSTSRGCCLQNRRFLVPGNTTKILTETWHQIWHKNDGENMCNWNYFQNPRVPSEFPANWLGLTSLSDWKGMWDLKKKSMAYIFTICQNWYQIPERFFLYYLAPETWRIRTFLNQNNLHQKTLWDLSFLSQSGLDYVNLEFLVDIHRLKHLKHIIWHSKVIQPPLYSEKKYI